MPRVASLQRTHPLDCLFVQAVRIEHAAVNWYYDRGYIHYQDREGRWLDYEHRLVARLAYDLPGSFQVHHIDGNRINNRADNLAVLTPSDHARLHKTGEYQELACATCGDPIVRLVSRVKRSNRQFCSARCRAVADRRVERPSDKQLLALMAEVANWRELGRMFDVSDNAVRKWARHYGLDLSICDGRRR